MHATQPAQSAPRRGVTDRRVRTQLLRMQRRAARRSNRAWSGWTQLGFIDRIEFEPAGDSA